MKIANLWCLAFALLLGACGGGDPPVANADISNRIYVLASRGGEASAAKTGKDYVVTLTGVEPEVDWYTDRPARVTGDEATRAFVQSSWQRAYGTVAPNALLQYRNASGVHGLFGAVQNLAYRPDTRTLQFTMTLAKSSYDIAGGIGIFEAPVLTVLNNLQPPQEGSSFALEAGRASLVANAAGRYRLLLQDVDDEVFWMNNAPSRAGDFEQVGHFVNEWPTRFGQVGPNASLAGDLGNGDYDILPLVLSDPQYDSAARSLSFAASALAGPGTPDASAVLANAVLFVDSGERSSPASVFSQTWQGLAYSPIPAMFNGNPTGAFFDSDMTAANFQSVWGSKDGCGRNDLETMAALGVNLVRLYDYNYQRGTSQWQTGGSGHIAFLDKAQALGIKVIIPVSNYNFIRQDGNNRPWERIEATVTEIVNSVKKNGVIHPAVHSFSVGNELDLDKYGMSWHTLIPDAVRVAGLLHQRAPDHYITVPISNANEKKFYQLLREQLPPELYQNRFYNSVQTFKRKDGDDLLNNILRPYDSLGLGVPLLITEIGTSEQTVPSVEAKIAAVIGQASAVRSYMDANPQSQVKGFAIFEWQNAHWKRNGQTADNSETTFGIQSYAGTLCQASTGKFYMDGSVGGQYVYALFHEDVRYNVDRLVPLTSPAYPGGLLQALSVYFRSAPGN